jgi:Tfp pilus assembly protein PilO
LLPSDQSLSPSMLVTNRFRYFMKKKIFYKFCVQKASQVSFNSNLHSIKEENRSQLNKRRFRIKLDKQITSSCLMYDILLDINRTKLGNGLDIKFHIVETLHYNYFGLVIT